MMSARTIVLITGGNRGLGRAYATALLGGSRGSTYDILITARQASAAQTAAKELESESEKLRSRSASSLSSGKGKREGGEGGRVVGYGCDITVEDQVEKLCADVERDFGRVDVLINNAGVALDAAVMCGTLTAREAWAQSYLLNVTSTHFLTKSVVPLLLRSPCPRIIFISSCVGSISSQASGGIPSMDAPRDKGWPKNPEQGFNPTSYRVSKAAFNMMAREWVRTLTADGVRCWILAMGGYATELGGTDPEEMKKGGTQGPEVAGEWVRGFVEGEHDGEEGKFMGIQGEWGW